MKALLLLMLIAVTAAARLGAASLTAGPQDLFLGMVAEGVTGPVVSYSLSGDGLIYGDAQVLPPAGVEVRNATANGPWQPQLTLPGPSFKLTVEVRFDGTAAAGPFDDFLHNVSPTADPALTVSAPVYLWGVVQAAAVLRVTAQGENVESGAPASGSARDFGSRELAAWPSAPLVVELFNMGADDLSLSALSMVGNAADFQVDTTTFANLLSPGTSAIFTVTFAPLAAGPRNLTISFGHNAPGADNPFLLHLRGEAVDPTNLTPSRELITTAPGCAAGTTGLLPLLLPALALLRRRRARKVAAGVPL
jgi:uncharacterized protein (TIGR03382 family)